MTTTNNGNYDWDRYQGKRTSTDIKYDQEQNYISIAGTNTRVLLEFPQYSKDGKSAVIELDDVMTIAFSSARAKAPVVPLGQISPDGFGLGTRTVAGTIVRSVFMVDNLTAFQTKIYLADQETIRNRLTGLDKDLPTGLPLKDRLSIVQDDLTAFNIHIYSISEYLAVDSTGSFTAPRERFDTIIGATIMNSGQVFSIEDLITESTMSFQAKAHRASSNITDYSRGYSSNTAFPSASAILNQSFK